MAEPSDNRALMVVADTPATCTECSVSQRTEPVPAN
jgi:hypothetical protein